MTISSVQPLSSITLNDLDSAYLDTITLSSPLTYTSGTSSFYTVGTSAAGATVSPTYTTISNISNSVSWGFKMPEEWVNCFPEWGRIEKMCETYPGLKIAFEKFKTTYDLVKDDYDTPADSK